MQKWHCVIFVYPKIYIWGPTSLSTTGPLAPLNLQTILSSVHSYYELQIHLQAKENVSIHIHIASQFPSARNLQYQSLSKMSNSRWKKPSFKQKIIKHDEFWWNCTVKPCRSIGFHSDAFHVYSVYEIWYVK